MNIEKELKSAIATGKVDLGSMSTIRNARQGRGKLIILAKNIQPEIRSDIESYAELSTLPVHIFDGSSLELGSVCKKPFPVAAMLIYEAGDSDILELSKGKK